MTRLLSIIAPFLDVKFAHFCWIGAAKFILNTSVIIVLVDLLGFSGLSVSMILTPTMIVVNWITLKHFIVGGDH